MFKSPTRTIAYSILAVTLACSAVASAGNVVWYVDAEADGHNTGISWNDAFTDLQSALDAAHTGDQIWVADGVYRPSRRTTETDPRSATFTLVSGVAMLGGFSGGELTPEERDWNTNKTVLSGDLAGDDTPLEESSCCSAHDGAGCDDLACEQSVCAGVPSCCAGIWNYGCAGQAQLLCGICSGVGNTEDNSYHVVTAMGTVASTLFDGFTVTAGSATPFQNMPPHNRGGGIYTEDSILSIRHCIVAENSAATGGGIWAAFSGIWVEDSQFIANYSSGNTGGVYLFGGPGPEGTRPLFVDCRFVGNRALGAAGLYYDSRYRAALVRCTFEGNQAAFISGAVALAPEPVESTTILSCTFRSNSAGAFVGAISGTYPGFANAYIYNSIFVDNSAASDGAVTIADDVIASCTFVGNKSTMSGAAVTAWGGSGAIRNCILWGNTTNSEHVEEAQIYRWHNGTVQLNHSCVQGLTGALGGSGNIGEDPLLFDVDGIDDIIGTADDDFRITRGSPCVDAGRNSYVPTDTLDLDEDGIFIEPLPFDFAGHARFEDDPNTPDTGVGTPPIVDIGALEYGYVDCNENGIGDDFDIADGASIDCNGNLVPDECEDAVCIISSWPPDHSIDARQPYSTDGQTPAGWLSVALVFNVDPTPIAPGAFQISSDPPGEVPTITGLEVNGMVVTLEFDRPIRPGAWTTVRHRLSGTSTRVGYLPGDVDGDGTSSPVDILRLIDVLNGTAPPLPESSTDLDRSGVSNAADVLREIDILTNCDAYGCWFHATLPIED